MRPLSFLLVLFAACTVCAADGYYSVGERDGHWCVLTPEGREHPVLGVDCVPYSAQAVEQLKSWGFNDLGGGGAPEFCGKGFSHTAFLGFDGVCYETDPDLYIRKANGGPMTALPNMFSPAFALWCDRLAAQRCTPLKGDRDLLGYFLDNELSWWCGGALDEGLFDAVAKLPEGHSAHRALVAFVAGREITRALKLDFLELAAEKYFAATAGAVRRHDSNHLVLGCRFAGMEGAHDRVWQVAGRHCDIISFNIYPYADLESGRVSWARGARPLDEVFERYHRLANRPILISEWSFPALDTGRSCRFGAGQRVPTQTERARAVELFVRTVLASPHVVGCEFYKWMDDPVNGRPGISKENCNYGLVSEEGRPYEAVVGAFAKVHAQALKLRRSPMPWNAVRFEDGRDHWRLTNAVGVELQGRLGGPVVSSVSRDGFAYGTFGSMVEVRNRHTWLDVVRTTEVSFSRKGAAGIVTITAETGDVEGRKCEVVHRLILMPENPNVHCELVSVRNLSSNRLCMASVYACPRPRSNSGVRAENECLQIGRVPHVARWAYPDGRRYGIRSDDPAVSSMVFALDDNGWGHADAAFTPYERLTYLEHGETYSPPSPWRAELLLE